MIAEESATTRKVLAAVPDETSDYRPAEKSMTGAELAAHIALSDMWFLKGIIAGQFGQEDQPKLKPSEALAAYDAGMPDLIARLKQLTPEQLVAPTTFFAWTNPLVTYLAFYLNHSIHHRGQLSSYLRPMGSKVPSIYGGSADEPFEMPQEATAKA